MASRLVEILRRADIFDGLSDDELLHIGRVCQLQRAPAGTTVFAEGDQGDTLFIIYEGKVRVMINAQQPDGSVMPSTINSLQAGQCFGEMVLLYGADRTATVVTAEPTILIVLAEPAFRSLCDDNPRIGYGVMRNLAQDLAYKLRSSNLLLRGNIRWRSGELDRQRQPDG